MRRRKGFFLLFSTFSMRTLCRSHYKRKGLAEKEPGSESVNDSSEMLGSIFVIKRANTNNDSIILLQAVASAMWGSVQWASQRSTPSAALSRYLTAFVVGEVIKCNQLTGHKFKRKCDAQTEQNLTNLQLPTSDKRLISATHGQCRD